MPAPEPPGLRALSTYSSHTRCSATSTTMINSGSSAIVSWVHSTIKAARVATIKAEISFSVRCTLASFRMRTLLNDDSDTAR
ncbi:hypothetical protein LIER_27645 [Lithospermum erythrorhizon]|uniref:Uncharacterized protein n=1 Tax=Lithospermum erythrorhizon TaxID=34254 RepID=A0AAV3RDZ4_LITER